MRWRNRDWKKARQDDHRSLKKCSEIKENKALALINTKVNDKRVAGLSVAIIKGEAVKKDAFVYIERKEFEDIVRPAGFQIAESDGFTRELVYERPFKSHPDIYIRILSSIDEAGISRRKGKDAIRVFLYNNRLDKMIGKSVRINRLVGWAERLKKKVNEQYHALYKLQTCEKCGEFLVERKAKRGPGAGKKFLGCSAWPQCR